MSCSPGPSPGEASFSFVVVDIGPSVDVTLVIVLSELFFIGDSSVVVDAVDVVVTNEAFSDVLFIVTLITSFELK